MVRQIIAIFILVRVLGSNSIPSVSFDPFDHPRDGDIVIEKQPDVSCPTEECVHFSGLDLKRIPERLVTSRAIESINLNNNDIVRLPMNAFNETPNLKCLNLARNKLVLERTIFQHDGLKTLILDHQNSAGGLEMVYEEQTPSLPGMFPNLETLSWKKMPYDFADHFLSMVPMLRNLYISDSGFVNIRSDIGVAIPHLETLHLERNRIASIRNVNFGNVEALYLDENSDLDIGTINLANAQNLKILSLSNCNITELPIFEMPSLKVLDVSHNFIRFVAEAETSTLEVLDISHNKLTTLPYLGNMVYLEKLSLSYNWIEHVNELFAPSSLVTLNLRGNRISRVESVALSNLVALRHLDLSENNLQYLPSDWNANLHSLLELNLKSNRFLKLETTAVYQLVNLQRLYVSGNLFSYIDLSTLTNYVPPNCTVYVV